MKVTKQPLLGELYTISPAKIRSIVNLSQSAIYI